MNWDLDYGELSKDTDFVNKFEALKQSLMDTQKVLEQLLPLKEKETYEKMSLPARIELDLFLVYTLNSLHWVYLRLEGQDPNKHPIKDELQRIKATMLRWQEVQDREKRPTVNIEAAKRFVRSGLYDPNQNSAEPLNKKIKFDDSDD